MDLVKWVKRMSAQDRLVEVVDPRLMGSFLPDDVEYVLGIALRCVEANALKRPRMSQVVHMLESEDPKQVRRRGRGGRGERSREVSQQGRPEILSLSVCWHL